MQSEAVDICEASAQFAQMLAVGKRLAAAVDPLPLLFVAQPLM